MEKNDRQIVVTNKVMDDIRENMFCIYNSTPVASISRFVVNEQQSEQEFAGSKYISLKNYKREKILHDANLIALPHFISLSLTPPIITLIISICAREAIKNHPGESSRSDRVEFFRAGNIRRNSNLMIDKVLV